MNVNKELYERTNVRGTYAGGWGGDWDTRDGDGLGMEIESYPRAAL